MPRRRTAPPPAREDASEKRCPPGAPGQDWGPGPWQLGSGEREGSGERSSESRLCTCALPAAAASLAVRACGSDPTRAQPGSRSTAGGHGPAGGPGNARPPPLASPALAPRTEGELTCLLDLFFFFFNGLTDLSREPGLPVGFSVWLQEEFFL